MMIIRKLEMKNFRGFKDKIFEFDDKAVVLVSAANGVGKTTLVDAIEWCLTGSIGRLKNAFDSRSTNDTERKKNTDGILKNRNAGKRDKVIVVLSLFDGEKEIVLQREQIKDELDEEASKVTIDKSEEKAEKFCKKFVNESFYNYHFCDVQKSFNIQSKKRKDMNELFREFITNYDDQINIANSLEVFAEDVKRYITDKINQKTQQEQIDSLEEQVIKERENIKHIPYPNVAIYLDENINISSLSFNELVAQKQCLNNCGYKVVEEILSKLVTNYNLIQKESVIRKIDSYWNNMGDSIRQALDAGLDKDTVTFTELEGKVKMLKKLSLSKDTIFIDCESLFSMGNLDFSRNDFEQDKKLVKDKENKVKEIENDIELLSNNNKILKVLSAISASKQEMIDYRNDEVERHGIAKCPICGSESFSTLDDSLILKEADKYITKNGDAVKLKEKEKKLLQEEITELYKKIIIRIESIVKKEEERLESRITFLESLNEKVKPYFEAVKILQTFEDTINIVELNKEKINTLLKNVVSEKLSASEEKALKDEYQNVLSVLGYEFEKESLKQTYEKVKYLAQNSYEVSNFSYEVFVSKINAINSILSNHKILDLNKRLEEYKNKNIRLDEEIKKLNILHETASNRAKDIKNIIIELSKDEYKKVGPAIGSFFNKLSRFNYCDGIHIVQEKDGLSIVDDKNKNIVNVLSNGQISVFMLAYFFAGINARNDREKMKVYFIDDLTACMDDVNMLAFMDLLKYQMSSKATMEQLFFVTCDERISSLFKYKMNGHEIEVCELREADFM